MGLFGYKLTIKFKGFFFRNHEMEFAGCVLKLARWLYIDFFAALINIDAQYARGEQTMKNYHVIKDIEFYTIMPVDDLSDYGFFENVQFKLDIPHVVYLTNVDVSNSSVSSANLSGSRVFSFNLSGTNLFSSYLDQSNLSSANLNGASLDVIDPIDVDLSTANLHQVSWWPLNHLPYLSINFQIGYSI